MRLLDVFSCGHGDTLLLHLPGEKWALIDCNLRPHTTRDKLFSTFQERSVNHLDLLCLSHPDSDHYWGMADVLQHFSSGGRSLGLVCIPPMDLPSAAKLIRARRTGSEHTEFVRFVRALHDLVQSNPPGCQVCHVTDHTRDFSSQSGTTSSRLIPLAPNATLHFSAVMSSIEHFAKRKHGDVPEGQTNAISVVWALVVENRGDAGGSTVLLLSGDLTREGWPWALEAWSLRASEYDLAESFSLIKVPHHGSYSSHHDGIIDFFPKAGDCFSVISVGKQFRALPDQRVLRAYLDAGSRVASTFKRAATKPARLISVLDTERRHVVEGTCQDILVDYAETDGSIQVSPSSAFIGHADLPLYSAAASS